MKGFGMTTPQRVTRHYSAANLEAAHIIAAQPEKYAGALQEWAAAVLSPDDSEAGPLFAAGKLKRCPEIDHDRPELRMRE